MALRPEEVTAIIKKELEKLDGKDIDRIIEKLKAKKNRTSAEDYVLQEESKHKKAYLDPNKKKLEDSMKETMNDFTKKLSGALETAKKK